MVFGGQLEVVRIRISLFIWMVILRLWQYSFPAHMPHRVLRRLLWASFVYLCVCLLFVFLAPCSIARGESVAYTGLSRRWVSYGRSRDVLNGRSRDDLYGRRRRCLIWPEMVMSPMAGEGDVSCGRRWLLTVIRDDGIQPYLHSHIYWPCGPLR